MNSWAVKCHLPGSIVVVAILIGKRRLPVVHRQEAMVGDSHPVSVAAQIVEHLLRTGNGALA